MGGSVLVRQNSNADFVPQCGIERIISELLRQRGGFWLMEESCKGMVQIMKKIENYMFNLSDKLGEGSFSQVYRGVNLLTNHAVAVKKIRIGDIKSKIARRLLDCEIGILKIIDHPNIIRCMDVHSSINNCYIITELCNHGDLDQLLTKQRRINPQTLSKIIVSIVDALLYLSGLGIIHRDLKVSNIFIHQDTYKLGDFGFAIKSNKIFKDVAIGSPLYMSPQGLIYNLYGPKTDVWSFGILIYELIHGTTPLAHCKTQEELRRKVIETPHISQEISADLRQLMLNCLKVSEKDRYSIQQISESTYVKSIRAQAFSKMDIQQDLTLTKESTSTAISENKSNIPQISYETALCLMHYCRFLDKIVTLTASVPLSKLLVWVSVNIKKGKYLNNIYSQEKYANLREIIKQYHDKYLTQHETEVPQSVNFQQIAKQCEKIGNLKPHLFNQLKNVQKESEMLIKGFENGCLESFTKRSKAKHYANTIR